MPHKKLRNLKNKLRKNRSKKRVERKAKKNRRKRNIERGEPETAREAAAVTGREAKGVAEETAKLAKESRTARVVGAGVRAAKSAGKKTRAGMETAGDVRRRLNSAATDSGINGPGSVDFAVDGDRDGEFDSVEGAERDVGIGVDGGPVDVVQSPMGDDEGSVDVVDGPGGSGGFDLDLEDID